jgi:WD40 repeat protein
MITELQNSTSGGPIYDVEFHPHEFLLAGGSHDRTVHFWDLEKFALIGADDTAVMAPATGPVRCIYFHPEGDCLFSGTVDGLRVHGWEPSRTFDSLGTGGAHEILSRPTQCCVSGSGIRCLFDPWIRDLGWVKKLDLDPGSGSRMNSPDHISESLENNFFG